MSNFFNKNLDSNDQKDWVELVEPALISEEKWRLKSRTEDHMNVYYHLYLVPPQGQTYVIKLPWDVQEFCFSCQSQGLLYVWCQNQEVNEAVARQDCQGLELKPLENEINLVINDEMVGHQIISKSPGSRWNARLVLRKGLILKLTWVEALPRPVT